MRGGRVHERTRRMARLNWSHILQLLRVQDLDKRNQFVETIFQTGFSAQRMGELIASQRTLDERPHDLDRGVDVGGRGGRAGRKLRPAFRDVQTAVGRNALRDRLSEKHAMLRIASACVMHVFVNVRR